MGEMKDTNYETGRSWFSGNMVQSLVPNLRGRLAISLVERWGMVATDYTGRETSSGRQEMRMISPAVMVGRAIETADILVSTMESRGWLTLVQEPKDED